MRKNLLLTLLSLVTAASLSAQSLSEGFEGLADTDEAPSGWIAIASGGRHKWSVGHYTDQSMTSVITGYHSGGKNVMKSQSGKISAANPKPDQWLITPAVKVASGDNLSFMMAYDATFNAMVNVADENKSHFEVLVSTTDTETASFTDVLYDVKPVANMNWRSYSFSLDKYAGKTVYIAFREYGNSKTGPMTTNWLYLDDVKVSAEAKADLAPTSLTSPVSGIEQTQPVTFAFNNSAATATGLKAAYSVDGGTPVEETVDGTLATGESLTYTFKSQPTLSRAADHQIKVWAWADNEFTHDNDTITATVHTDGMFALPYSMTQDNMASDWSYSWHKKSGTRYTGWWLMEDDGTKYWSYMTGTSTSLLQGKWFVMPAGKLKLKFTYKSMLEVPLTITLDDCDKKLDTVTASATLPVAENGGTSTVYVDVPQAANYQLSLGVGTYAGQLLLSGLDVASASPVDASVVEVTSPDVNALVEGSSVTVGAKVMNAGTEELTNVPLTVSLNGREVATGTVERIAIGETANYTFDTPVTLTKGFGKIVVKSSAEGDGDPTNNSAERDVTVYSARTLPFADSFEDELANLDWITYNTANDLLSWGFTSTLVGNVNYGKDGNMAAFMSSGSGIEHDDWLVSPAIKVTEAGKARLSYYYTTRMTTSGADNGTFLTAYLSASPYPSDISKLEPLCTDTITNANLNAYRQGYALADITQAGTYYVAIHNTGTGHSVVLDDVRLDRAEDLAVVGASQTAVTGFGNTTDVVTVKVANHGVSPMTGFTLSCTVNDNAPVAVTYDGTLEANDTVAYSFSPIDVAEAGDYVVKVAVADSRDADTFNNAWTLPAFSSYADATVPYSADFESEDQRVQWQLGAGWQTGTTYSSANSAYDGKSAISHHKKASTDGDWAVSGCISIPAGTYDLSFFYRTYMGGKTAKNYAQNFAVYLGTSPDPEAMTKLVYTSPTDVLVPTKQYEKVSAPFTVEQDGKFYIGVKCTSSTPYGVLFMDRFAIDEPVTTGIAADGYKTDFKTWSQYDLSSQFDQWESWMEGGLQLEHQLVQVGTSRELPRALVSPAFMLSKGDKLTATIDYSMAYGDASLVSDEEKAKAVTGLYIASADMPDAFTTAVVTGSDISGDRQQATATYEVPETGLYWLGIGTASPLNTTVKNAKTTLTYHVFKLALKLASATAVNGIEVVGDSAVEVFTTDGVALGRFTDISAARQVLPHSGVYVVRTGGKAVKMVW